MFTIPSNASYAPNAFNPYSTQYPRTQVPAHQQSSTHNAPHDVYEPSFAGKANKANIVQETAKRVPQIRKELEDSPEIKELKEKQTPDAIQQKIEALLIDRIAEEVGTKLRHTSGRERRSEAIGIIAIADKTLQKNEQTIDQVGQSAKSQAKFDARLHQDAKMKKGQKGKGHNGQRNS